MIEPMTLLQRGVIQRLREAGVERPELNATADLCRKAWSQRRMLLPHIASYLDGELAADFLRANEQARPD